jgi:osmotically-inducible protein OsmY
LTAGKPIAAPPARPFTQEALWLSGFAKSWAERDRAENLARAVKGVTGVRNDIIVRAPS